jgi:hypothetical protein
VILLILQWFQRCRISFFPLGKNPLSDERKSRIILVITVYELLCLVGNWFHKSFGHPSFKLIDLLLSFLWDKKNVLLLWVCDVATCCIHFPFCVLLSHLYEIYDMYIRIFSSYHIWFNRSLFVEIFHRVLSSPWFFPITLGFSIGWLYI